MKFIHTFWSKPLNEHKSYNINLTSLLTVYAYSAECIRNLGETIELYADEYGAELLSFIPYNKVHIVKNIEDNNPYFFAQMKLFALKECDLGDVLIDGDLFLYNREVINKIEENKHIDVIYSYFEPYHQILKDQLYGMYSKINSSLVSNSNINFKEPYKWPSEDNEFEWMNTSLLVFNNQELKDRYIEDQFYYQKVLNDIKWDKMLPDVVLEQRFLTLLAKDYTSMPILEGYGVNPQINEIAIKMGFTHLCTSKLYVYNFFQDRLFELNNDLYTKLHAQIKKYMH
jgi:hypothetical protein